MFKYHILGLAWFTNRKLGFNEQVGGLLTELELCQPEKNLSPARDAGLAPMDGNSASEKNICQWPGDVLGTYQAYHGAIWYLHVRSYTVIPNKHHDRGSSQMTMCPWFWEYPVLWKIDGSRGWLINQMVLDMSIQYCRFEMLLKSFRSSCLWSSCTCQGKKIQASSIGDPAAHTKICLLWMFIPKNDLAP